MWGFVKTIIKNVGCAICVIPLWLISTYAQAVITDNLTIGNAKALSLGHAVTADPPGIDSVHYNPAGLIRLQGRQAELKLVTGKLGVKLVFDDHYTPDWSARLQAAQEGAPEGFTNDPALGQTSQTDGAALMLPFFGMTHVPVLFAPLGGVSYSLPNRDMTVATNVYAPLMVGFSRGKDDPGHYIGEALSLTLLTYFSPSLAIKVNDDFAIGGAITFNYAAAGLKFAFREPNVAIQWLEKQRQGSCNPDANPSGYYGFSDLLPCVPADEALKLYGDIAHLDLQVEEPLTLGMNVGFLWDVTPWLHLGAVYQSPVRMNMKGDFTWLNSDRFQNYLGAIDKVSPVPLASLGPLGSLMNPVTRGTANIALTMPDHFAVGTSVNVTGNLKVNMDLKFTRWSLWKKLPIRYSQPIGVIAIAGLVQPDVAPSPIGQAMDLNLGFKDGWNYAVGMEYQWNPHLALRLGFEDRPSSIPKEARSPVIPIGDAKLYAIGAEYKTDSSHIFNVALSTLRSSIYMPGNTSKLGNSEDPALLIYNPYSGMGIQGKLDILLFETSYRFVW